MIKILVLVIILFIALASSTSCYINIVPGVMAFQCEGLNVASDCRGQYQPDYPYEMNIVQNIGCDINDDGTTIFVTGTNCGAGSTDQCSISITKQSNSTDYDL
eukprot:TRINITY_DN12444_c0_g1_i1.p1 TRINITY_DN12444_c0_g1~~TRINITY_DN12444_c0_g1_i1.p1  ORF type:complete len:103 (-),score=0.27 TRINITY_DN12444_c0_g1_i1:31-339(-)